MTNIIQVGLYVVAGFAFLLALAVLVIVLRYGVPYALDRIERHKRGPVASPFGSVHPPTNRELRRARREFPGAKDA